MDVVRTLSRPLAIPKESVRVACWNVGTMFSIIALTCALEGKCWRRWPRETLRRKINKEREHLGCKTWRGQWWQQKTELLGGDGSMAPFSKRREGKDDDDDDDQDGCSNTTAHYFVIVICYLY